MLELLAGVEPAASSFAGRCSSIKLQERWWRGCRGSNPILLIEGQLF